MDGGRFDTLAKTVAAGSRRQALGGLLVASLALLSRALTEEAAAHDAKKKCQKKEGDAKKKCLKKAKKHNASHTTTPTETTIPPSAALVGPPPPAVIPATCKDGIQNGSESDVDCGGPVCLRCAVGQRCFGRSDCGSANCVNNVCAACIQAQCGTGCVCQSGSCINVTSTTAAICNDCPPYSACEANPLGGVSCWPPCG